MTADFPFHRRLLNPAELAAKLGYVRLNTDLAAQLDRLGFPAPVLGAESGNAKTKRWDEHAVDLWLDARLPEGLRTASRIDVKSIDTTAVAARLARRAQEIHL